MPPRVVATLAGMAVGGLVAAGLVARWRSETAPVTGPPAVAQFLDAWERSRVETYVARADVVRTTPEGTMTSELEVIQRPPDVLRRQHGSLQGRVDGRVVSCAGGLDDVLRCGPETVATSWEAEVAGEVRAWETLLTHPGGTYTVSTAGDGCFDLVLAQLTPAPPWGTVAQFCFDDRTGAMLSSRIERAEGTDVMTVTEVWPEVGDADFALPG